MTEFIILAQYRENNAWVILFQEEHDGPVMRLITDCYLNEWMEVVA